MIDLKNTRKQIVARFRGTALQSDGLRIVVFSFLFIHSIYSLSFFYWVDLAHYASSDAFTYMPTGIFCWDSLHQLGKYANAVWCVQYLFSGACLCAAFGIALRISQPLAVIFGFFFFGILNCYISEANTEYMTLLVLVAFALPAKHSRISLDAIGTKVDARNQGNEFSTAFFFCMVLVALAYLNSASSHIFFYKSWMLSGEPLKNVFLFKLNNDLNYSPLASEAFSSVVEGIPSQVYHAAALGSLLFEGTFWTCLVWPRLRIFYFVMGLLFHISIVFFMNIFFAPTLVLYLGLLWWEIVGKTSGRTGRKSSQSISTHKSDASRELAYSGKS